MKSLLVFTLIGELVVNINGHDVKQCSYVPEFDTPQYVTHIM